MSRAVDLLKVNHYDFITKVCNETNIEDIKMLENMMAEFGNFIGDYYIILNDETNNEFNSYYGMFDLIERYFGEDLFSLFLKMEEILYTHNNMYNVASKLGIYDEIEEE